LHAQQRSSLYIRVIAHLEPEEIMAYSQHSVAASEVQIPSDAEGGGVIGIATKIDRRAIDRAQLAWPEKYVARSIDTLSRAKCLQSVAAERRIVCADDISSRGGSKSGAKNQRTKH
jgi:hypothetical protein